MSSFPLTIKPIEQYPDVADAVNAMVVEYETATGHLRVHSQIYDPITTIELVSASKLFQGERPAIVSRTPFDVFNSGKAFSLYPPGEAVMDFGAVLPPGLTLEEVRSDLRVGGSFLPSGGPDATTFSADGALPSLARMSTYVPLSEQLSFDAFAETTLENPAGRDVELSYRSFWARSSSEDGAYRNQPRIEYRFDETSPWQMLYDYGLGTDHRALEASMVLIPSAGHETIHLRFGSGSVFIPFSLLKVAAHPALPERVERIWFEVPANSYLEFSRSSAETTESAAIYDEQGQLVSQTDYLRLVGPEEGVDRYRVELPSNKSSDLRFSLAPVAEMWVEESPVRAFLNDSDPTQVYWTLTDVLDMRSCDPTKMQWVGWDGPALLDVNLPYSNAFTFAEAIPPGNYLMDFGESCRSTTGQAVDRFVPLDHSNPALRDAHVVSLSGAENIDAIGTLVLDFDESISYLSLNYTVFESGQWLTTSYLSEHSAGTTQFYLPLTTLAPGSYEIYIGSLQATDDSHNQLTMEEYRFAFEIKPESETAAQVRVPGDINFDGRFDAADLALLGSLEYDAEADWEHGDFDGDGKYTTADLVLAMANHWDSES